MLNDSLIQTILFSSIIPALTVMGVMWLVHLLTRNASWVDVGWAESLMVLNALYFIMSDGMPARKLLILVMVTLWGSRLIVLLLERMSRDGEDPRYREMRAALGGKAPFVLFILFAFEAVLAAVLSAPFFFIAFNPSLIWHPLEFLGAAVWLIGWLGELTADAQLASFKENPRNRGKTCQAGFWNYSRHPNYFFEWLTWIGYALMALTVPGGWIALSAPLIMIVFLLKLTGVPFSEAMALKNRGEEYRRYQKATSIFIPLPKKKIR